MVLDLWYPHSLEKKFLFKNVSVSNSLVYIYLHCSLTDLFLGDLQRVCVGSNIAKGSVGNSSQNGIVYRVDVRRHRVVTLVVVPGDQVRKVVLERGGKSSISGNI